MGAAVVSGVDAPPILEPSEHCLDLVALLIEDGVMGTAASLLKKGLFPDVSDAPKAGGLARRRPRAAWSSGP
jgi:hypothetical protein